jgi:hypothetical protein
MSTASICSAGTPQCQLKIYLRADPSEKLTAIEASLPPDLRRGVVQVEDRLMEGATATAGILWRLTDAVASGRRPRPGDPVDLTGLNG